ncbi:MAG: HAD-IIB family hydrolase [bacterium]|nr:HAD-IIB family hydrolase [bacterium]
MFLLATDLDRTLLPNGKEPDGGCIKTLFDALSERPYKLAYVTGRNFALAKDAADEFGIPIPDFLLAEVGTVIYKKDSEGLKLWTKWRNKIRENSQNWNYDKIAEKIMAENLLSLQEDWKQNEFKLSFYLKKTEERESVFLYIRNVLETENIDAEVVWSTDPLQGGVGLVDILPKTATKSSALEFVRSHLKLEMSRVVYCGDSGNDILPLFSGYKGILVKNASADAKKALGKIETKSREAAGVYFAKGDGNQNGNYACGILEGLRFWNIL